MYISKKYILIKEKTQKIEFFLHFFLFLKKCNVRIVLELSKYYMEVIYLLN